MQSAPRNRIDGEAAELFRALIPLQLQFHAEFLMKKEFVVAIVDYVIHGITNYTLKSFHFAYRILKHRKDDFLGCPITNTYHQPYHIIFMLRRRYGMGGIGPL